MLNGGQKFIGSRQEQKHPCRHFCSLPRHTRKDKRELRKLSYKIIVPPVAVDVSKLDREVPALAEERTRAARGI